MRWYRPTLKPSLHWEEEEEVRPLNLPLDQLACLTLNNLQLLQEEEGKEALHGDQLGELI